MAINRVNILRSIEGIAEEWKKQGYSVKANLDGWSRPNKIDGLVPDLRATRGGKIIIGKIETDNGLESNKAQWEVFKNYAEENDNASFRLYLLFEDGSCTLYKIFS